MTKMKALDGDLIARKSRVAAVLAPPPEVTPRKIYQLGEPMNFRVKDEFKRLFKSTAAQHGLKMNELLVDAFELWMREKSAGPQKVVRGRVRSS
jgi:hypothetical protein